MNAPFRNRTIPLACGFAIFVAMLEAAEPTVIPVSGESFAAKLESAAKGKLSFSGVEKKTLDVSDLVRYGEFVEPKRGPVWLLVDGGALVADDLELAKDNLQGQSALFGKVSLPVSAIAGILVRPPGDKTRRDALVRTIVTAKGETDRILLDNGDELTGTIEAISGESISLAASPPGEPGALATGGLRNAEGRSEVELSRVSLIVFNPSLAEKPRPPDQYLMLGFSDGSRLMSPSLTAEAKDVSFKFSGVDYKTRANALVGVQVFGGRANYLSDLKELSFKHMPYLQLAWPLHKNASVLGQPLRVGGKRYLKGLGMHTAARVAYKLDGPYREFQAELAIDDSAAGRGSAACSVFVDDGSGKWQPKFTSPVICGGDPPIPVRVDLTGVKAISLLADFADHGDELDHVDWLDARLVK